jgi:autotransporter-associated beta strand protein
MKGLDWNASSAARLARIVFAIWSVAGISQPANAVLTHRYNFTTDANDSVGGAHWTNNGATFSGGQVVLDGVDDYLSRATTPLPTTGSMSLEIWGTYSLDTAAGSRIFDFSNAAGNSFLYLTPSATPNTPQGDPQSPPSGSNTRWRWNDDSNSFPDIGPISSDPSNVGQETLLTLVFDATASTPLGNGEFRLYRDGSLVATDSAEGLSILNSISGTTSNRLGHGTSIPSAIGVPSPRDLPSFLTGSLNELRIYNHVLTSSEILTNGISGPDTLPPVHTNKVWIAGNSNWSTDINWSPSGVPTITNRATIGNGGTANVSEIAPQVGELTIANGTVSVGNGGVLNVKYPIQLNTGPSNSATINVTSGGTLEIGGILAESSNGAKTINIDGGTIRPGYNHAVVQSGATTNVGSGGATFDTPEDKSISWNSSLAGNGDIFKVGSGTLVLRPQATNLALQDQNPDYSGEVFVNEGTLDIQREHGVLGTSGSTHGGKVHLHDANLLINTAYPLSFRKEVAADVVVTGENKMSNLVDRPATEIRLQGSISGAGSLTIDKPHLADAIGIDIDNRPSSQSPGEFFPVDNSGLTGSIRIAGNFAVRFMASGADFPNGVFELADPGAWAGKRGNATNQVIQLGGVSGVAGSRLQSSIAGDGDVLADVTYEIGGANKSAEFFGNVIDSNATDQVTVIKVGGNTQVFAGANSYSGTTTINGGTLLVNGSHERSPLLLQPIGDYFVNAGGTLGGTGSIGTAADPVQIFNNGGIVSPGSSPGKLTLTGNYVQSPTSRLKIEIGGTQPVSEHDQFAVVGNVDLGGTVDLEFINHFAPTAGQRFEVLTTTGSLNFASSQFAVLGLQPGFQFEIHRSDRGLELVAMSDGIFVPEPNSAIILISAGLILASASHWRGKRRNNIL